MTGITVGVDGSETAQAALAWADREAQLHGWPLTAVMAWGLLSQQHVDPDGAFDPEYGEADAQAALDAFVEQAIGGERAAAATRLVVNDLPAPALLDAAANATLVVVGSRGRGGFKGMLLGSVSQHVLHHVRRPLAIVRPVAVTSSADAEQIVVGIDGSAIGLEALRWAVAEAGVRNAILTVVHSWHMPYAVGYPYVGISVESEPFEEAAQKVLDEALAAVDTTSLRHPVEQVRHLGGAAEAILARAKGATLVVVGSRGVGGFTGLLVGSVSHQVARHAPCPVVVIPPPA